MRRINSSKRDILCDHFNTLSRGGDAICSLSSSFVTCLKVETLEFEACIATTIFDPMLTCLGKLLFCKNCFGRQRNYQS